MQWPDVSLSATTACHKMQQIAVIGELMQYMTRDRCSLGFLKQIYINM